MTPKSDSIVEIFLYVCETGELTFFFKIRKKTEQVIMRFFLSIMATMAELLRFNFIKIGGLCQAGHLYLLHSFKGSGELQHYYHCVNQCHYLSQVCFNGCSGFWKYCLMLTCPIFQLVERKQRLDVFCCDIWSLHL